MEKHPLKKKISRCYYIGLVAFGCIKYSWDIESRVTDEMKTNNEKCTYKQAKSFGAAKSSTKDGFFFKKKKSSCPISPTTVQFFSATLRMYYI